MAAAFPRQRFDRAIPEQGEEIENSAPVDTPQQTSEAEIHGVTRLLRAVCNGNVELVEELLSRGTDVNARRSDGFTPLLLAAFHGYEDLVELLLAYGADASATSRFATSAAMWADARGYFDIGDAIRDVLAAKATAEVSTQSPEANDDVDTLAAAAVARLEAHETAVGGPVEIDVTGSWLQPELGSNVELVEPNTISDLPTPIDAEANWTAFEFYSEAAREEDTFAQFVSYYVGDEINTEPPVLNDSELMGFAETPLDEFWVAPVLPAEQKELSVGDYFGLADDIEIEAVSGQSEQSVEAENPPEAEDYTPAVGKFWQAPDLTEFASAGSPELDEPVQLAPEEELTTPTVDQFSDPQVTEEESFRATEFQNADSVKETVSLQADTPVVGDFSEPSGLGEVESPRLDQKELAETVTEETPVQPKRGMRVLDESYEPPSVALTNPSAWSRHETVVPDRPPVQTNRQTRVLDEFWEPPNLLPVENKGEFHPGQVFVSRLTSTWTSLAVTTVVFMLVCGAVTFAVIKLRTENDVRSLPQVATAPVVEVETPQAVNVEARNISKFAAVVAGIRGVTEKVATAPVTIVEQAQTSPITEVEASKGSNRKVTKKSADETTSSRNASSKSREASSSEQEEEKAPPPQRSKVDTSQKRDEPTPTGNSEERVVTPPRSNGEVRERTVRSATKPDGERTSKPKPKVIQWP